MEIYDLTSRNYIEQLNTVDNLFIRQLFVLASKASVQRKMLTILSENVTTHKSDVGRNLSVSGNCSLNICDLPPLLYKDECKNIVEDIAKYRWEKLSFNYDNDYWRDRSNLLFLDYILSSCFCYVEVFEQNSNGKKSNMVEKFYATRNRFIAGKVANVDDNETAKYVNYLTPVLSDYKMESLRVLKLNHQKKGYKITQPRSAINFTKVVKITPVFFISTFLQGLSPIMKDNIVKFTYVKDNGQERELISTLSKSIFKKYYDSNYAEEIVKKCELKLDRGYLKVPELGCSKYDETGMRALNITRITNVEIVDSFDDSYINVDFNNIIPTFKATIEALRNKDALTLIYQALLNTTPSSDDAQVLRSEMMTYIDGRFAIGTSTFQKELHNFMLKYNMIFRGYTGAPLKEFNADNIDKFNNFNLGFE